MLASLRPRHLLKWVTGWAYCCHRLGARRTPRTSHTTTLTPRGSPPSSTLPGRPYSEISSGHIWLLCNGLRGCYFCAHLCPCSLMQRRYSEPNTYIDTLPSNPHTSDELYDDVAFTADPEVCFPNLEHKWSHNGCSPQLASYSLYHSNLPPC